tara:strand:+ start:769 stop:1143 length:375 start_codon:yes stop_codon:yes gene_type:complete
MPFPALQPTSRDFTPGNWPVKSYKSQSGAEVRILYGDTRTSMELTLGYDNISDAQAEQFLTHYDETKGTYNTFAINSSTRAGWSGTAAAIDSGTINRWRYADPPQVTAVKPGVSSVRVSLMGVF